MEDYIRSILSPESLLKCYGSLDNVAIVTLAPELHGADDAIKWLTSKGVVVSLGEKISLCVYVCVIMTHGQIIF